jgi:hypothetical protein
MAPLRIGQGSIALEQSAVLGNHAILGTGVALRLRTSPNALPFRLQRRQKDLQVPPKQNLPVIRKTLAEAGNKNFEGDELPGLNHLFQTAKTGAIGEYSEIEETMSPVAMGKIAGWILNLPHKSA